LKIGVFDSGVGGLTVLRELLQHVPHADYIYFGDTARLPYGAKSAATVAKYATGAVQHLVDRGAEFIVVACNTATALAIQEITASVHIPVIGVVEPGAEQAMRATKSKNVAVIATEATVGSHAYLRALERRGLRAQEKACPLLVPLIEEGWTDHSVTEQVVHIYLDTLFREHPQVDTLLLGCTHYPLIRELLRRVVPTGVAIVDSAESTALAVAAALQSQAAKAHIRCGEIQLLATDSTEKFRRSGERFLGRSIEQVELVTLHE